MPEDGVVPAFCRVFAAHRVVVAAASRLPAVAALALVIAACGTSITSPTPGLATAASAPGTATPTLGVPPPSPAASGTVEPSTTGFAFDAESVLGYYRSIGYTCAEPVPSTEAAGHDFTSCSLVDGDGRTRVIGLVTDPTGALADGFASMRGRSGEAFLEPTIALEPLAGFLGAMLGAERGSALVPWLAGNLGNEYAETSAQDLHVATYTRRAAGQTVLFVEVANDAYLAAPRPSASPGPGSSAGPG